MITRKNSRFWNFKASWDIGKKWLTALFSLMAVTQPAAAQVQSTYDATLGGYLEVFTERTPEVYDAGYSFYTAAWPLLGVYPAGNGLQTGLYGTWLKPQRMVENNHYSTIEGGLGWWLNHSFQTATPKFMMGGVSRGNEGWWYANGPGSGSTGGNGIYGAAQLSSSLLFPLDGLNLRQGTSGQLFGYGYLALPLTEPKTTTAGMPFPTGNHCWTLFLNSGNYKGPTAFFTPFHWSQAALLHPEWAGETFDTRWCIANRQVSMETGTVLKSAAYDTADATYVRTIPSYYPVDANGYSLLMHRPSVYDQGALWNEVGQWLTGSGPVPRGVINSNSTYVQHSIAITPKVELKFGGVLRGETNWTTLVTPSAPNKKEFGYQWNKSHPSISLSANGALINLPQYYKGPANADSTSSWEPITQASLPQDAATALAGATFANPTAHPSIVAKDADPVWTSPGPASGPYRALLGDGSVVTYYWYRFADQPAMLKADMTLAARNQVQVTVEKMHREWKNDCDYIAPPTAGSLADLDPGQLMTPPLGLEYGYVPIAWQQDWGGSVASLGSLNFTAVPGSGAPGTPFSATVRAVNTSGVAQNVTSDTLVQLSVGSGYGTLSGTTSGTISSGNGSVTISGISYSAADTMTLTAAATCLSPGISANLTFTNFSGLVNLYNKPATTLLPTSATLNASLDCRGTNADVKVYWGIYNGGITPASWTNSAAIGISTNVTSTALRRTITGLLPETKYYFTFSGTNSLGSTWSSKVLYFTTPPLSPTITTQPASSNFVAGSTPKLTVVAAGPVSYQWFKGGIPLINGGQVAGATTATLSLSNASSANVGSYSVVVTNVTGQVTSATASLALVPMSTFTWDANGTTASITDGAGQWQSNSWWNGTSNVTWIDNNNVQVGSAGTGGVINFGEVMVSNLILSNFSGNYTLSGEILTVGSSLIVNTSTSARLIGVIRGAGSLTKNGTGLLTVDGLDPSSYSGGTVINGGTLDWGTTVGSISPSCDSACGTGPVTLNSNATIRFERANVFNALTLNGGTLMTLNGFGARWSGPVTVNSNNFVQTTSHFDIFGDIGGMGGFTKTANGVLIFAGNNTYRGSTVILGGKVEWQQASSMSPGHLLVSSGAKAVLNYSGARAIQNLTLGGVSMAVGLHGSSASPATYQDDTYFSGTGMVNVGGVNVTPVALAQGVATIANRAVPVTLTGTDLNGDSLSFSIVAQPTSGTLSVPLAGSGANWIYTPASNFVGVASFTFKANDGLLDSLPATVTITIRRPVFIWKSAVSGNWADPAMWLEGWPGNIADALNFNVNGAYTATRDLSPNFQVNRLNFGGSTVALAGGTIGLVSDANVPPTINQSSNSQVLINSTLNLGNDTTVAGAGLGNMALTGLVSGSGGLIKNTQGVLGLDGLVPNTYSGGTTINSGLVHLGTAPASGASPVCVNPAGTGPVTLNAGATLEFDRVIASNSLVVNGGSLLTPNGWGVMWSGPVMLNANLNCNNDFQFVLSGAVGGTGGVIKTRGGLLLISGAASYSGNTTVSGGTFQMNSANSGNDDSTLTIASSGATLNLNFTGTDTVNQLVIGTTPMAAGVYGAGNIVIPQLTGTGTLTVVPRSGDIIPPTLIGSAIVDDKSGGPLAVNTLVTYTVTFSEDMDASTVTAIDFGNAGTSTITIGAVSETAPGVFTVPVIPTSVGTLQLRVNAAAVLTDVVGNVLITTSAILDNTAITVAAFNNVPVAMAQSVTTPMDTSIAITLAGADVEGSALVYSVVTLPSGGQLISNGQNQTYKPATNFVGLDSFTFKVNDGLADSATAVVTITVTPPVYTWANTILGNWTDSTKWAATGPSGTGQVGAVFNFNPAGTYTATNDLAAGFLLNQLNFGGSTVTLAGNGLSLSAFGTARPLLNQNSAYLATVSTNLALAANTTVGGSGEGAVRLSGIISGGYTLTKTNSGSLTLSGVNTYSEGTVVSSGTLVLAKQAGFGTGPVTLAAGTTFQQSSFEGNSASGALPNVLVLTGTGNVIFNMPFSSTHKDVWLGQPISGSGGLTVQGGGRSLTLAANNTFSGGVRLTDAENRIQILSSNALGTGTFRTEHTSAGSEGKLTSLADLSSGVGVPNAFDIATGACLNLFADGLNPLQLSGPITSAVGTGSLHKSGTATLTLSGVNTYTGTTTVAAGTLACNRATALGQGPVVIATAAKLNLNFTGARQVVSLSLAGVPQNNGTYGSTTSQAINRNDSYFTGDGVITVGPITTTTTVILSNFNPAALGAAVTFTAKVNGSTPTGNVSFYNGVTIIETRALNSSSQASVTTNSLVIGTSSITAVYEGNANNTTSGSAVLNQVITLPSYQSWAADPLQGLVVGVDNGPLGDPDRDGISNLMEFVLGGLPMASSQAILPVFSLQNGAWVFEYSRSDISQVTTIQTLEYGNNLVGWTSVTIPPTTTGIFQIINSSPFDRVKITVPVNGNRNFIRLKITQ